MTTIRSVPFLGQDDRIFQWECGLWLYLVKMMAVIVTLTASGSLQGASTASRPKSFHQVLPMRRVCRALFQRLHGRRFTGHVHSNPTPGHTQRSGRGTQNAYNVRQGVPEAVEAPRGQSDLWLCLYRPQSVPGPTGHSGAHTTKNTRSMFTLFSVHFTSERSKEVPFLRGVNLG